MPDGLTTVLYSQIYSKLDRATSKEAFYVSMALGRGLGRKLDEA